MERVEGAATEYLREKRSGLYLRQHHLTKRVADGQNRSTRERNHQPGDVSEPVRK